MGSPRGRTLHLLSLLQSGRQWSAGDLAAAAEVTPRTLRRDIEGLRQLGYPVKSVRGPGGHYQLVAGRALPPLMFEDDEAIAAVLGLHLAGAAGTGSETSEGAAARAEAKLRSVLPAPLRETTEKLLAALDVSSSSHALPDPLALQAIATAIAGQETLRFDYAGPTARTERDVEPARLVRLQRHFYLLAWDRDRVDWRTFRLDRIVGPPTPSRRFTPRRLPADDVVEYLREHFSAVPEHTVVLTLQAPAGIAAMRLHRVDGVIEPIDEGSCRYTAHVDSFAWLTTVLMLTDLDFSVDEPMDFRDHLSHHAERLLRAVADDTA